MSRVLNSLLLIPIVALMLGSGQVMAAPITHRLIINPIQVRDDSGLIAANPTLTLFEAETDKIWSQAGIDIKFLNWKYMNDTDSLFIDSTSELLVPGNQALPGPTVNMWFVIDYVGAYGAANSGGRRIAIDNSVFSYAGGAGRRDTIAHEIGHILGLPHISGTFPLNLMESGGVRNAATAFGQITPDGAMKSQLTAAQMATALASPYLIAIPEPSGLVILSGLGLLVLSPVGGRRLRNAA